VRWPGKECPIVGEGDGIGLGFGIPVRAALAELLSSSNCHWNLGRTLTPAAAARFACPPAEALGFLRLLHPVIRTSMSAGPGCTQGVG